MYNQMNLFDSQVISNSAQKLEVVMASFNHLHQCDWQELFNGYDELYAITFSSGLSFVDKVLDQFSYAEIIYGCENVINNDLSAIMSMQMKSIEQLIKHNSAKHLAEKLESGTLKLFVSRDTKSHEKIFILKSFDGRVRVITGSANMSASAFCGLQRENIVCFDDSKAFDHYIQLFKDFREQCADTLSHKAIFGTIKDSEFLQDNIDEIPIIKTISHKHTILLEESHTEEEKELAELVVSIHDLENEIRPMLPKQKKNSGKILLTTDLIKAFKRKHHEHREQTKVKIKKFPKLHINYESNVIDFNGKLFDMYPSSENIANDVSCLINYLSSLNSFYGDYKQSQRDYFSFLNWFFASPFMPYLRYVASKNNYEVTPFPVIGIIYGESNGGKSTFTKLMTKLMCGHKVPMNSNNDFTLTHMEELKRSREGLPIIIDDLAKSQFANNCEKIIKDDEWGISEGFINYPSITITTNKLASLTQDITKRAVTCYIDSRIDKEAGAKNCRRINESMRMAGTSFFSEYARRMLQEIIKMEEHMKNTEFDYFPDIFEVSSKIIVDIISTATDNVPDYVEQLTYSDYFGDKAVGRKAMKKIMNAWKTEPKQFKIDSKLNTLTYSYPEQGRMYELSHIQQELPPVLNARLTSRSLIMDLDQAKKLFGISFKKRLWT